MPDHWTGDFVRSVGAITAVERLRRVASVAAARYSATCWEGPVCASVVAENATSGGHFPASLAARVMDRRGAVFGGPVSTDFHVAPLLSLVTQPLRAADDPVPGSAKAVFPQYPQRPAPAVRKSVLVARCAADAAHACHGEKEAGCTDAVRAFRAPAQ